MPDERASTRVRRYELSASLNERLVTVAMGVAHSPVRVFMDMRAALGDGDAWSVLMPMRFIVELLTRHDGFDETL